MTKFKVHITETVVFDYEVDAASAEEAEEKAEEVHLAKIEGDGAYDWMQITDRDVEADVESPV